MPTFANCRTLPLLLLLLLGTLVSAGTVTPEYSVAAWGTEQGLPSNAVLDIRQTRDGYLWLASYQGLVRFDGSSFRIFTEDDIPGLNRASFWALAQDSSGALWASTESSGLVRYADGRFTVLTTADGLPTEKLTEVVADGAGTIWIGSRRGVSRIVDGKVENLPAPPGEGQPIVAAIAPAPDGSIWIATAASGLLQYRDGKYRRFTVAHGLSDNRTTAVLVTNGGEVWVGTYGAGVMRVRDGVVEHFATNGSNAPRRVNEFYQDQGGVLWVAADNGLFRMQGGVAIPVALSNAGAIAQVEALRRDSEDNLWIGSRQSGLYRLRPAVFQVVPPHPNDPASLVYAVETDGGAGLWIATEGGVLHRTALGTKAFTAANGALRDDVTRDVLRDREGVVWAATNGGLTRIENGRTRTFTTEDGLADLRCRVLAEDSAGALWIGTSNGLSRLDNGKFRTFGPADGVTDSYILSLYVDRTGTLWVGTQSEGLLRFENGRFVPFQHFGKEPVFRMSEDVDGNLWVGTARGLVRIRNSEAVRFTVRNGLPGNAVFQAVDDGRAHLWLTGPWGFARVAKRSLEEVAAGREKIVVARQFGSGDGLVAREAASISKAWAAPDGRIFFATPAGLAVVAAPEVHPNAKPLRVLMEQVVADGETAPAADGLRLPPGTRKVEFHFAAPSFVAAPQVRFRYKLEGFDENWIDGGTRRVAFYTNIPPGSYTFHVMARNEDGVWSAEPASLHLDLRHHFWQTWWFAALALAGVALAIYAIHKLRMRALQLAIEKETAAAISLRDDMTGLYNRRGLLALAEQQVRVAERRRQPFDLIFIDMDGLKEINDQYGHAEGDQALIDVANVLRSTFRDSDVVARIGGDEFAALVVEDPVLLAGTERSAAVCDRIYAEIGRFNAQGGRRYTLSVSAGTSRFDPAAPVGFERLLDNADRDMYEQKREKRGQ